MRELLSQAEDLLARVSSHAQADHVRVALDDEGQMPRQGLAEAQRVGVEDQDQVPCGVLQHALEGEVRGGLAQVLFQVEGALMFVGMEVGVRQPHRVPRGGEHHLTRVADGPGLVHLQGEVTDHPDGLDVTQVGEVARGKLPRV